MTETNKENLIYWCKGLLLGLIGFLAIITSSGVWNGVANDAINSFYGWVAGLNLIAEGFCIWVLYKKLFPKKEKKDENK